MYMLMYIYVDIDIHVEREGCKGLKRILTTLMNLRHKGVEKF